jgi:phage-related protein
VQAVYYRDADGSEPVREFIDTLPSARQVALGNKILLLNMLSPNDPPVAFPHSSQIRGELRELRCHYGRELYRILYQRSRGLFVLLHALEKRTGAIPRADIEVAERRMTDFLERMNASPRTPPRPAGRDAP